MLACFYYFVLLLVLLLFIVYVALPYFSCTHFLLLSTNGTGEVVVRLLCYRSIYKMIRFICSNMYIFLSSLSACSDLRVQAEVLIVEGQIFF